DSIAKVRGNSEPNEWAKAGEIVEPKKQGPLQFRVDIVPSNIFLSFNNTLMLQVIFFAIFFGIMLLLVPASSSGPVNAFMIGCNDVFMKMVEVVMMAAPYFVFALMTGVVARMAGDDPAAVAELFKGLAGY